MTINTTLNLPTGFAVSYTLTNSNGFNDLYLDSQGNIATVGNIDALTQSVQSALWLYISEYDFDTTIGIPWNSILNNEFVEEGFVTYQISNAIMSFNNYLDATQLEAYGINTIDSITYNLNTKERSSRILTVNISITLNNNQTLTFNDFSPNGAI